ncbi:fimbrillin family protein [Parabacteroides faecis]|uniref:fimbrillin family protein n=1 Tax=Parabacteroides faecis TaxID=1217282 RepID=UPI002164CEB9|nr:fimbrillin family protein [Parabacteroides faecis]MCS2893688.1 fimbrillin family protein [Parabacteroides faecis]UVQ47721.1 fimbrillin family protein [Parabacteroides faecis]
MNNFIVIAFISIAILPGFVACSDSNPTPEPIPATAVCLEGAIGQSTRGVIGSGYEKDLEVCFARQDETTVPGEGYGTWGIYEAVRRGGKGNRPIVFAESQSYPEDGRRIRLHGYYPAKGESESVAGAGKVTFTVDGTTDIMSTGILTGSGYSPVQTCMFRHLLTQVRLVCYSDQADRWGTIKTIEAIDVHTRQTLDLEQETSHLDDISLDDGIKNIPVKDIVNLPIPEVTVGEDLPEAQGYLLLPVSPVDGTAEHPLHLRITTTKDGRGTEHETVSEVSFHIEGGFQTGKSHVVTLFFTDKSKIQTTSVSVEAWTDHEQDDMPI